MEVGVLLESWPFIQMLKWKVMRSDIIQRQEKSYYLRIMKMKMDTRQLKSILQKLLLKVNLKLVLWNVH